MVAVPRFRAWLISTRRADRTIWILLGALWAWKIGEVAGKALHPIPGNLGWGSWVDVTLPIVCSGNVGLFFFLRHIALHYVDRETRL